jgi:hypothetical protein
MQNPYSHEPENNNQNVKKDLSKTFANPLSQGSSLAESFLKEALTDRQYLNIDPRKLKYREKL